VHQKRGSGRTEVSLRGAGADVGVFDIRRHELAGRWGGARTAHGVPGAGAGAVPRWQKSRSARGAMRVRNGTGHEVIEIHRSNFRFALAGARQRDGRRTLLVGLAGNACAANPRRKSAALNVTRDVRSRRKSKKASNAVFGARVSARRPAHRVQRLDRSAQSRRCIRAPLRSCGPCAISSYWSACRCRRTFRIAQRRAGRKPL